MQADPLDAYRCRHGHLLLGCPDDDCPEQTAYLEVQERQLAEWERRMEANARAAVREVLGLPVEEVAGER